MASSLDPLQQAGFQRYHSPQADSQAVWQIVGADCQILEIAVPPSTTVITEPGTMCHVADGMAPDVEINGCGDACKRSYCAGESFFRLAYTNSTQQPLPLGLTPNFPAKIVAMDLNRHNGVRVKSGAFMAAIGRDVRFVLTMTSCTAGCCGGQGFILNELHGSGMAFLNAGGTILQKDLQPGEVLLADTHSVVAFEKTVHFDVQRTGGLCVMCCGGEGMFNTKLTGPGTVWVQSLSFEKFAKEMSKQVRREIHSGGGGAAAAV